MMPTIGTIIAERSLMRLRIRKKIIVPVKADRMATTIFTSNGASGKRISTQSRPSPAHSLVPVVVGSTKRFWAICCITRPDIAMAEPASSSEMVRGIRVRAKMWAPSWAPTTS